MVLDKLDYCATLNNLKSVRNLKNFRFVKGDIQCMDLVSHVLEKEEIDTVMHFAAQVRCLLPHVHVPVAGSMLEARSIPDLAKHLPADARRQLIRQQP